MSVAVQFAPESTQRLSWAEICSRYPDQYVCLVDVARPEWLSPEILSARVVGHGPTHDAAFEPVRELEAQVPRFAIRYTGRSAQPLLRPSLIVDDEILEPFRTRP